MKRSLLLPLFLMAGACSAGAQDGQPAGRTGAAGNQYSYDVGAFDSVSAAGPYHVIVTTGGAISVRAEGDPESLELLEVKVEDGTLKIGTRRRNGVNWDRTRGATVHVNMPSIRRASLAGSGDMRIDRVSGGDFDGSVAGSGDLIIDTLESGNAEFSIAGSGNVRAAGRSGAAEISIAGSGDADLSGLASRTAEVSIVGSGAARVNASETVDVSIMGSGDVEVTGGARCSVSKMGGGDVRCG